MPPGIAREDFGVHCSGKIVLGRRPLDLAGLVETGLDTFRGSWPVRSSNLLDNGIKYIPPGRQDPRRVIEQWRPDRLDGLRQRCRYWTESVAAGIQPVRAGAQFAQSLPWRLGDRSFAGAPPGRIARRRCRGEQRWLWPWQYVYRAITSNASSPLGVAQGPILVCWSSRTMPTEENCSLWPLANRDIKYVYQNPDLPGKQYGSYTKPYERPGSARSGCSMLRPDPDNGAKIIRYAVN